MGRTGEALRLSDFLQGQKGRIVTVRGDGESRRRMCEMGFTRGMEVQVVRAAPLKDPVEYLVKGYHVSLRREQAALILMDRADLEVRNSE
ncbi:MAG: FeoA family protein [Desulfomonilaceae bacterium]|nr:FeoA family protein [Desulfomonilaceae bacterium]